MFDYLPELEFLHLSVNQISGEIPSSLFNCKQLQSLTLSFNNFTGSIPAELGNFTMLINLVLGANNFKGTIPEEIGNLPNLQILALQGDNLRGTIPPAIFNMSTLTILALASNQLTEYGLEGNVSRRGDVYSYGILLLETFIRKKPCDEIFLGELSLKTWVKVSCPHSIINVVDNYLVREEEENLDIKKDCLLSIIELASECSASSPEERSDIKDVLVHLLSVFHQCSFCFIPRTANATANWLATTARKKMCPLNWVCSPPPSLVHILSKDGLPASS
ncbi:Leucine-rich repeat receptor-like protein kinase family protein [Quillaja saponaria]|uniref:Leucine-rich repeat receptor-like protein kinase family protein n=1 Tax=Quillaja saponaria TaxID=32244 RepID=A0AAD7P9Y8_QUISA|nr:Leucine-rich repeat receptor-like protein kinase family protein [Quillaja saponaria]